MKTILGVLTACIILGTATLGVSASRPTPAEQTDYAGTCPPGCFKSCVNPYLTEDPEGFCTCICTVPGAQ